MKALFSLTLAAGLGLGAPSQAAVRIGNANLADPSIVRVEGGCGPGGHRDRYGECRPNYPPPNRRCPPWAHPTPYGCRPNR